MKANPYKKEKKRFIFNHSLKQAPAETTITIGTNEVKSNSIGETCKKMCWICCQWSLVSLVLLASFIFVLFWINVNCKYIYIYINIIYLYLD